MRILIATSLYPPDVAAPALYVKELAKRLAVRHEVTVLAYGELPEPVERVRVVGISKRQPLLARLFSFARAFLTEGRRADIIYLENGASAELPAAASSLFLRAPVVLHIGDTAAHARAGGLYKFIELIAQWRAKRVITQMPEPRPEILPFLPYPEASFASYERSWQKHLDSLDPILKDA